MAQIELNIENALRLKEFSAEAMAAIDSAISTLERAKRHYSQIADAVDSCRNAPEHLSLMASEGMDSICESASVNLFLSISKLSNFFFVPTTFNGSLTTKEAYESYYEAVKNLCELDCFFDGDSVFIKTIMLPPKASAHQKNSPGVKELYVSKLGNPIACLLRDKLSDPRFDRKKLARYSLGFLFVYNEKPRHFLVDNDNHDIKNVVDTIAGFFGGDSALRCRLGLETVLDDSIPEGTYITVQPYDNPFLPCGSVTGMWKKHLGRNI